MNYFAGQTNPQPTPSPPTAYPTADPTAAPTDAPTVTPTVAPTDAPTVAPTDAPTVTPTKLADFHAEKKAEHGSYKTQFTNDCDECLVAEKYAAMNATECTQKHAAAQRDAETVTAALSAQDTCKEDKLAAEAAAASAKATVAAKVSEVTIAVGVDDDAQKAKVGAATLCSDLIDDWITKMNAVVPCDDFEKNLKKSKKQSKKSSEAAKACDIMAQTAMEEAIAACDNLVLADDQ
jgi:hypothetical protein